MPPRPYYSERAIELQGETYRLVLNFHAIDATESEAGDRRYDDMLNKFLAGEATVGTEAKLLWGMLREHHPTVTVPEAAALMTLPGAARIGYLMREIILATFPPREEEKPKAKNPPRPRGALRSSSRRGASKTA